MTLTVGHTRSASLRGQRQIFCFGPSANSIYLNFILLLTALTPLNVYTGQNPRRHVVLIEIQPNACNKYLSRKVGVILRFVGVVYFCIFGICFYNLCCVFTLFS
jgi:hypothetical protein